MLSDDVLGVCIDTGATILVPADVRLLTPFVLLEQERWFEDEVRLVSRALGPGMRAVDVGANYGCYSTAMAMAVGPAGHVLCCEPAPDTARLLRGTLERNGLQWAEVSETAVSDGPGEVRFRLGAAA